MSHMTYQRSDFTYSYNANGYMIFYHGKPIGGAGTTIPTTPRHWRHNRQNLKDNQGYAEASIQGILNGVEGHYREGLERGSQ